MNKKSLVELKKEIEKEIAHHQEFININKDSSNPQVKELYNITLGKIEALQTVLYYTTNGSTLYFEYK